MTTPTKTPRQASEDHLRVLTFELEGLSHSILNERDPEELSALRAERAEVRRCINQEKALLAQLNLEPTS